MEDPGVVANTRLQAYLVLPTKDNSRKRETAFHVIFVEEKKIGSKFQLFSCTNGTFSTIDKQVATALFLPTFHQLLKVVT
jgi:hypothetical protein